MLLLFDVMFTYLILLHTVDSTVSELVVSCTKQFNIDNTLSLHVVWDLANVYQEIQAIEKFDIRLHLLNSSFSKSVTVSKQVFYQCIMVCSHLVDYHR